MYTQIEGFTKKHGKKHYVLEVMILLEELFKPPFGYFLYLNLVVFINNSFFKIIDFTHFGHNFLHPNKYLTKLEIKII